MCMSVDKIDGCFFPDVIQVTVSKQLGNSLGQPLHTWHLLYFLESNQSRCPTFLFSIGSQD